jgi:hypothetical protein
MQHHLRGHRQPVHARRRGIDHAPSLHLAGAHGNCRQHVSVHEEHIALAAVDLIGNRLRRLGRGKVERPVWPEAIVSEDEDPIRHRRQRIAARAHDECTDQSFRDLEPGPEIRMWVIPVRTRAPHRYGEHVGERCTGLHRVHRAAIHIGRDVQAVPVDARGLRQAVREVHDHAIALVHVDRWARIAAVVREGVRRRAGKDRDPRPGCDDRDLHRAGSLRFVPRERWCGKSVTLTSRRVARGDGGGSDWQRHESRVAERRQGGQRKHDGSNANHRRGTCSR